MKQTVLYFAYGSNMKTERMSKRVPSANAVGRAKILNKRLVCNKKSKYGSGKANLTDSPGDVVWGVLYEITDADLRKLDRFEGDYRRVAVEVLNEQEHPIVVQTYVSGKLTTEPIPYDWYKALIVEGAREHRLPEDYLKLLEGLPAKPDPRKQSKGVTKV